VSEFRITTRERQVLHHLSEGKQVKAIAVLMGLSPRTVESYKYRMMRRVGAKTAAELVRIAIERGVRLSPESQL
jgi:DNA-binding NarL/FixJ family response regulator